MRALEWLEANGKAKGARMLKRVAMSVPSHSSLLRDAAAKLAEPLASTRIRAPEVAEPTVFDETFSFIQEGVTWFGPTFHVVLQVRPAVGDASDDDTMPPPMTGGCSTGGGTSGGLASLIVALAAALRRRRRA
jgi:MYXO-CTERM domain-containing protein